jgi:hypothetical protein
MAPQDLQQKPDPDPPRGIPQSQATLIALAVRRQHLAEMFLGNILIVHWAKFRGFSLKLEHML